MSDDTGFIQAAIMSCPPKSRSLLKNGWMTHAGLFRSVSPCTCIRSHLFNAVFPIRTEGCGSRPEEGAAKTRFWMKLPSGISRWTIYMNILGRRFVFFAHINFSRFDCDTIVAQRKMNTHDLYIFTGFRIQTVRIRGRLRILY